MAIDIRSSVAFVILSCDKYSDLWKPCISRLYEFWPNIPFSVYLASNMVAVDDERVTALLSGEDLDWSSSLRKSLQQLDHPYVFLWFDDAFLSTKVNNPTFLNDIEWGIQGNVDYLRFRDIPKPNESAIENIGRLKEGMPYRTTCFVALWKKEVLLDLLKDGESAADFEMKGTVRSYAYSGFYGVYRTPFNYIHGVVRGRWLNTAFQRLLQEKVIDCARRPVMTAFEEFFWGLNEFKSKLIVNLPPGWANKIFSAKRALLNGMRFNKP